MLRLRRGILNGRLVTSSQTGRTLRTYLCGLKYQIIIFITYVLYSQSMATYDSFIFIPVITDVIVPRARMRTKERIKTNGPRNRFKFICFVEVCYLSCVSYQWELLLFFLIFLWYQFSFVPCLIVTFLHSHMFNSFSLSAKLLHCSFYLFSLYLFTYTLIFFCYIHLIHLMTVVVAYFQLVLVGFWARV